MELFVMNSSRKSSLIAGAVASVLGAGWALALPPGTAIDYTLYSGGGSAQANAFFVGACQIIGTNADMYTTAALPTLDPNEYVITGTTTAAFTQGAVTVPAGKNVMWFYKYSKGSYTNGVAPQTAGGGLLGYPTVAEINAGLPAAPPGTSCTTGQATVQYSTTYGNSQQPIFGLSDVEVGMFQHYNNNSCGSTAPAKNCDGGPAPAVAFQDGIYDNLFGIAETDVAYSDVAHPKKNFTRAEMEGIISGAIGNWNQLYDDNGNQMPAQNMIFLDRTEGSGTKTSGSEYFLGYPSNGTAAVLPFSATGGYTGTTATIANVRQVVAEASTAAVVADLIALNGAGLNAVAVLGLENPPGLQTTTGAYDFTAINGVHVDTNTLPADDINGAGAGHTTSYVNVIRGDYDFYYQNSFNAQAGVIGGGTIPDAFAGQMKSVMQLVGFSGCNSGLAFPLAVTGTLIDADVSAAIVKGVTLATRGKNSQAPLQQKVFPALAALPACTDP